MRLRHTTRKGVRVIKALDSVVVGHDNAKRFESEVISEIGNEPLVVLDASRIDFFESDGVESLLEFERLVAERNGRFVLSGLNEAVREIFRISGLDCLFHIYPNVDRAVHEVSRRRDETECWH
jgi:anti-anti-sigma factor